MYANSKGKRSATADLDTETAQRKGMSMPAVPVLQQAAVQKNAIEEEPLQGKFATAQLVEEEEPLQGKFETAQLVEEEEPLQGKFETAQLVEEEEPLQGKFETTQLVEEEEPLQGKFETAQLVEDEEPLQGKFATAQLIEEEEPLQGKFETAQLVEEEEPLQGKFETAQLVEEEEPLQGKFATAQLVEEEEPLQGKFETAQLVEDEEPMQGKFETTQLVEDEEPLQGKFETAQLVEDEEPLQGKFDPIQRKENNTGLPNQLKAGVESLSGMSMDHVKVHYNSDRPAQLNAHAYAQGSDIHVAAGQEKHLPHEAWHVVQQAQGRVKPTMQMKGNVPVNDDTGLENEADVMGANALSIGQAANIETPAEAPSTAGVVQGYFTLRAGTSSQQDTNDPGQFKTGASLDEKREQVWLILKPELKTTWEGLPGHHFSDEILEEFRKEILVLAFNPGQKTLLSAVTPLERTAFLRANASAPLTERASPGTVGGTLTPEPTLAERDSGSEKHTTATYKRNTGGTVTDETFDSDDYTKAPARRRRDGATATTPTGVQQAWTKRQITNAITVWTGEDPLTRHLATVIWPLLTNSATGKKWEIKFREIDRLITLRDAEPKNLSFDIMEKQPKKGSKKAPPPLKKQTVEKSDYILQARLALKAAILANTKHPADQQDVLFYDTLLKADIDAGWQNAGSTTFTLADPYTAESLSMTLTHWRAPILFDWILAEDVLNNATP